MRRDDRRREGSVRQEREDALQQDVIRAVCCSENGRASPGRFHGKCVELLMELRASAELYLPRDGMNRDDVVRRLDASWSGQGGCLGLADQ